MRRRDVLHKIGTASVIATGGAAFSGAASGRELSVAEANNLVTATESGVRQVIDISDATSLEEVPEAESDCDEEKCTVYCCDDCPQDCYYSDCGGCLCNYCG